MPWDERKRGESEYEEVRERKGTASGATGHGKMHRGVTALEVVASSMLP